MKHITTSLLFTTIFFTSLVHADDMPTWCSEIQCMDPQQLVSTLAVPQYYHCITSPGRDATLCGYRTGSIPYVSRSWEAELYCKNGKDCQGSSLPTLQYTSKSYQSFITACNCNYQITQGSETWEGQSRGSTLLQIFTYGNVTR